MESEWNSWNDMVLTKCGMSCPTFLRATPQTSYPGLGSLELREKRRGRGKEMPGHVSFCKNSNPLGPWNEWVTRRAAIFLFCVDLKKQNKLWSRASKQANKQNHKSYILALTATWVVWVSFYSFLWENKLKLCVCVSATWETQRKKPPQWMILFPSPDMCQQPHEKKNTLEGTVLSNRFVLQYYL